MIFLSVAVHFSPKKLTTFLVVVIRLSVHWITFKRQNSVIKIWQLIGGAPLRRGASHDTTGTMDNPALIIPRLMCRNYNCIPYKTIGAICYGIHRSRDTVVLLTPAAYSAVNCHRPAASDQFRPRIRRTTRSGSWCRSASIAHRCSTLQIWSGAWLLRHPVCISMSSTRRSTGRWDGCAPVWELVHGRYFYFTATLNHLFICLIAIAYSMGQIIKSVCVCQSVSLSVRLRALSRSHFFIDFHQNWHRRKNPQKEERVR